MRNLIKDLQTSSLTEAAPANMKRGLLAARALLVKARVEAEAAFKDMPNQDRPEDEILNGINGCIYEIDQYLKKA